MTEVLSAQSSPNDTLVNNDYLQATTQYKKVLFKEYSNGRKHVYGVDEDGHEVHISHDSILAAYGHDPKLYLKARGRVTRLTNPENLELAEDNVASWKATNQERYLKEQGLWLDNIQTAPEANTSREALQKAKKVGNFLMAKLSEGVARLEDEDLFGRSKERAATLLALTTASGAILAAGSSGLIEDWKIKRTRNKKDQNDEQPEIIKSESQPPQSEEPLQKHVERLQAEIKGKDQHILALQVHRRILYADAEHKDSLIADLRQKLQAETEKNQPLITAPLPEKSKKSRIAMAAALLSTLVAGALIIEEIQDKDDDARPIPTHVQLPPTKPQPPAPASPPPPAVVKAPKTHPQVAHLRYYGDNPWALTEDILEKRLGQEPSLAQTAKATRIVIKYNNLKMNSGGYGIDVHKLPVGFRLEIPNKLT